jgi:hypothetical protein
MKHFPCPSPLDVPYFQIGTNQFPNSPRPVRDWFKPKLGLALTKGSYPLLLSGGVGSGRYKIVLQMLMQNIHDRKPFIFVRGTGDNHSFDALFGVEAGPLIHALCLREQLSGNLVDLERFRTFLNLDNLQNLHNIMKYQPAKKALEGYLTALGISSLNGDKTAYAFKHNEQMRKAWAFFHVLEHSKLCSTTPDVDFRNLFMDGKHVCVTMPSGQNDHDYFGFLPTLFTCLISQSTETTRKVSANPEVIFDSTFEQPTSLGPALDRLVEMNTVFAIHGTFDSDDKKGDVVSQICSAARSVLLMKSQFYCFPNTLKVSAFKHGVSGWDMSYRDVVMLYAETGFAWGCLTVIRKGKPYCLSRLARVAVRASDPDM